MFMMMNLLLCGGMFHIFPLSALVSVINNTIEPICLVITKVMCAKV